MQTNSVLEEKFTSKNLDQETGLYYFECRYYDPEIGIFIQPDTMVPDPESSQDFNRYMYCRGNPVRYNDPDGHNPQAVINGFQYWYQKAVELTYRYGPGIRKGAKWALRQGRAFGAWLHRADAAVDRFFDRAYDKAANFFNNLVGIRFPAQELVGGAVNSTTMLEQAIPNLASKVGVGFRTFARLKNFIGVAGKNFHWHHIVEQNPGNLAKFGPEAIHNTLNVLRTPARVHYVLTGFYNSIQPLVTGSTSMTVRQWLNTKPFSFQLQFGIQKWSEVMNRMKGRY